MQTQMQCAPNSVKWLVSIIATSTLIGQIHSFVAEDQHYLLFASIHLSNEARRFCRTAIRVPIRQPKHLGHDLVSSKLFVL